MYSSDGVSWRWYQVRRRTLVSRLGYCWIVFAQSWPRTGLGIRYLRWCPRSDWSIGLFRGSDKKYCIKAIEDFLPIYIAWSKHSGHWKSSRQLCRREAVEDLHNFREFARTRIAKTRMTGISLTRNIIYYRTDICVWDARKDISSCKRREENLVTEVPCNFKTSLFYSYWLVTVTGTP